MSDTTAIDPTARIDATAQIGEGVSIGAYSVVGPNSRLGQGTVLKNHVTIGPNTVLGSNNTIYPHAVVGGDPQDLLWHGEETYLTMGDRNVVREGVTINRGTMKGDGYTRVGNGNLLMAYAHVAHDCLLGDHVIMANNSLLAGHVIVHDRAILNGAAAVHQFTTIGRLCYVGGLTRIVQDVPPFMIVEGNPSKVRKVNLVGLQRLGVSADRIREIREAFRVIYRSRKPRAEIIAELEQAGDISAEVRELVDFLKQVNRGRHGRSRNV